MQIAITKTTTPKQRPQDESHLGFGQIFTDHMFLMEYTEEAGWQNARIVPFGPLPIHPASTVLHYGAEIFEGMKAYRTPDGKICTFRPYENARRMNDSAERLCLPQIDEKDFVEILDALITLDKDWVPHASGTALYIRPFLFGNDPNLSVHAVKNAVFAVILSPVGAYYPQGINPVKIAIESQDVRAVRGGTGYAKCGGNYAASLRAGERAEQLGFTQVLWLDGVERKYIEEVGSMNVMFSIGDEIVTPKLTGSVLPGVTRRSCVELLRDRGLTVNERLISVDELISAAKNGTLSEAWGTGTAAVISPIGVLRYGENEYVIHENEIGPTAKSLYDELTGIQSGILPDRKGWVHCVTTA